GVEHAGVVLDEPAEPLLDADDLDVEVGDGRPDHPADRRVQARTVAAAGQDAHAPGPGCYGHLSPPLGLAPVGVLSSGGGGPPTEIGVGKPDRPGKSVTNDPGGKIGTESRLRPGVRGQAASGEQGKPKDSGAPSLLRRPLPEKGL